MFLFSLEDKESNGYEREELAIKRQKGFYSIVRQRFMQNVLLRKDYLSHPMEHFGFFVKKLWVVLEILLLVVMLFLWRALSSFLFEGTG
ncbi:hypothetical protein MCO_00542 [Bartonella sp. DB5-6]|uniref:hypothetical protein n=1 Tax=Bartonella sp. DB5-6 TaxID=1094755 RepID=UPI00026E8F8D|nr:hypothetical protein [Bartonella sp. DB5-6]EJF79058.1 hypothetical protein MCO_00542 [Bartonella sp. DB5-6]